MIVSVDSIEVVMILILLGGYFGYLFVYYVELFE